MTSTNANHELTVEAWINTTPGRIEAVQSLVSKWQINEAFTAFSAYDAGDTDGLDSRGFLGTAFDGRYVYFPPQATPLFARMEHGVMESSFVMTRMESLANQIRGTHTTQAALTI